MLREVAKLFPKFAKQAEETGVEEILPPASAADLVKLEERLGLPLPESYKALLRCARGFWLMGGAVQLSSVHPFFHEFEPFDKLSPIQRRTLSLTGGNWPPPSEGMLCFAEFFMEADGDQVLFDTSRGMVNGEYPIMYYAHEDRPPSVRRLADSFSEFMEGCLEFSEWR